MDKLDKLIILEKYVNDLEYYYDQIKLLYKFLNIDDKNLRKGLKETLIITKDKIKNLKKCKTLEDFDKYVNVDKIIKDMRRD